MTLHVSSLDQRIVLAAASRPDLAGATAVGAIALDAVAAAAVVVVDAAVAVAFAAGIALVAVDDGAKIAVAADAGTVGTDFGGVYAAVGQLGPAGPAAPADKQGPPQERPDYAVHPYQVSRLLQPRTVQVGSTLPHIFHARPIQP